MKKIIFSFIIIIYNLSSIVSAQIIPGKYSEDPASSPLYKTLSVCPPPTQRVIDGYGNTQSVTVYGVAILVDTVINNGYQSVPSFNACIKTVVTDLVTGKNVVVPMVVSVEFWNSPRTMFPGRIPIRLEAVNGVPRYFIE